MTDSNVDIREINAIGESEQQRAESNTKSSNLTEEPALDKKKEVTAADTLSYEGNISQTIEALETQFQQPAFSEKTEGERERSLQENAKMLTDQSEAITEETNTNETISLSSTDTTEDQKTEKTKSRLSRAVTKLKDGVHNSIIPDIEKITDRNYTQKELLQLVKQAEAEVLKEELEKLEEEGFPPAAIQEIGAIDIEALAQTATELTEHIQKNEDSLAEIAESEKNGKKVPKEEFLTLWEERGELMDTLYTIEWKKRAYAKHFADKALQAFIQKLFEPFNKLLMKMWKELNKKNPDHPALSMLRTANYVKTRKAYEGEWGLREEIQYRNWRKGAQPADLALRITELQVSSSSPTKQKELALTA